MSGKTSGTKRRHPGIKGIRPDNKASKITEANERLDAGRKLSFKEQLEMLSIRLKKFGGTAKKQVARIQVAMNKPVDTTTKVVEVVNVTEEKASEVNPIVEKVKKYMANKKK